MTELSESIDLQPITSQPPIDDLDVLSQPVIPAYPELPTVPSQTTDYLPLSLFTMLYCCFPIGLIAFLYSLKVREANLLGDQTRAQRASRIACILNVVSVIVLFVIIVIAVLVVLLSA
ncbi:synapse differentiation-inducing gene protein 1-like [Corticium candelabrum]|uniref:synapse differentiation-inducing gene protein 1-like n=1 Tax=Corticium candelabrum TaxID=121492 RepID=UPI002E270347|nr:synapse differentiation-inducing gene protein 1-like [Corticium candelabrum]